MTDEDWFDRGAIQELELTSDLQRAASNEQ